ncbi:Hypothetical predicted protein, partial [Paramuricea clavata]
WLDSFKAVSRLPQGVPSPWRKRYDTAEIEMEETSEGVLEEMEEITSSVKPSGLSSSSEELTMLLDEDAFHMNIAIDIVENDDLS